MLFPFAHIAAVLLGGLSAPDTTITVQGLVAAGADSSSGSAHAAVVLAEPLVLDGEQIWVLALRGAPGNWGDWDGRYVEATGVLGAKTPEGRPLASARLHEVKPRGGVRREVVSLSHRSEVTLALVPTHFRAVGTVSANPITPLIYFEVLVQGQTNLIFETTSNDLVCVSVRAPGERDAGWRDAWRLPRESGTPLAIRIGPVLRVRIPIPGDVVSRPGTYTVQATLCGNPDFTVTTEMKVAQP